MLLLFSLAVSGTPQSVVHIEPGGSVTILGGSTLNIGVPPDGSGPSASSTVAPPPPRSPPEYVEFFRCSPGSSHVIGHFEDGPSFSSGDCFMNRLPSNALEPMVIRASVSGGACGSAVIEFAAPAALVGYLRDGTQAGFVDISATLVSGTVENMPTSFYTGVPPPLYSGTNKGWILGNGVHNGNNCSPCNVQSSFVGSYNYNTQWNYCNSAPNVGGELVTLSANYPPAPPSPPPMPPALPPTYTPFFHCRPGSSHVIGAFEDGPSFSSGDCFMNRLPASAVEGSVTILASVSGGACGEATIEFAAPEALVGYLRDGTQASFVSISPTLVSGTVETMPTSFYTGVPSGGNKGWVIGSPCTGGCPFSDSFASSYNFNNMWNYCNGAPNVGSELVTLSWI